MLELADTTAKDKNVEENKRKKAKLLKKLKEQESLANANNAVSGLTLCFYTLPMPSQQRPRRPTQSGTVR